MNRTEEFWDQMATSHGEGGSVGRHLKGLVAMASYVSDTLKIDKKASVLDVCCGNGLITNRLSISGASVTGVDLSGEMIKNARLDAESCGNSGVRYIRGDAAYLPFDDNTFDATYCFSSFQLFPSYSLAEDVLKELLRITKPGGRILIGEVLWRDTLGYKIWNLIRVRGEGKTEGYIPLQDMPLYKKMWERFRLVFRRLSGRRVASDDWLWYDEGFFRSFIGDKFGEISVSLSPKECLARFLYDVVIYNR